VIFVVLKFPKVRYIQYTGEVVYLPSNILPKITGIRQRHGSLLTFWRFTNWIIIIIIIITTVEIIVGGSVVSFFETQCIKKTKSYFLVSHTLHRLHDL